MTAERVVIVGAGHAGGSAAAMLRQSGFSGEIILIGEEASAPYQRPPLSKAYLKGAASLESLLLRPESFYHENHITLRLGARVECIDPAARTVVVEGPDIVAYDTLIIATGSHARRLTVPGNDLNGLHELRSATDAQALAASLQLGKRLAVVGGGYVGLEAAASARALGAEVIIIERESRILARVACEQISHFFQDFHRANGVVIETGCAVTELVGNEDGWVRGVRLGDGRLVPCDAVLVGIGAMACSDLAVAAGIACADGILVDRAARTSDPNIFAIGDVSYRPMPLYGNQMFRLESVQNALEQAKQAVAAITGREPPMGEVPWFWSDQYELKLQIAGVPFEATDIVLRGSLADAKFAIFHLLGDQIRAVEAVNSPMEFMMGRQMIASRQAIDRSKIVQVSIPMKAVAAETGLLQL